MMIDRRKYTILAIFLVTGLFAASCGKKQVSEQAKDSAREGKTWIIGMSQCNLGEPWRVQMNADIEAAAKKHPEIKVIFKDAQNNTAVQQAQVKEFISQGVDLIIISPKEARPLTKPVAEAIEAGIPVIVLDRKVEGDKYTCFIGADNVKIGREAGKYLVKILGGKGKIVELKGLMTSTPGQERHNGFMEGIKGSKLEIIFSADCRWLEPNAQREMASALARFPQIDAVYGHNDPSAHGAYMAAKQEGKGREKKIKFIGIDALPHEGIRYVKEGILTATFQYPTGGAEAIDVAIKILKGEKVPKNITLGTRIYTKENVEKGGEAL
ncbi:MAG: substrate-binding domain-containing protein [Armatimonadota bacterium]|nr:substrate-binding domain-containing protein [Armatimonadota bacterium]